MPIRDYDPRWKKRRIRRVPGQYKDTQPGEPPLPGEEWKRSVQCLTIRDGDLVVLKFRSGEGPNDAEMERLSAVIAARAQNVQLLVLPSTASIQNISKDKARKLLQRIVDSKQTRKALSDGEALKDTKDQPTPT